MTPLKLGHIKYRTEGEELARLKKQSLSPLSYVSITKKLVIFSCR